MSEKMRPRDQASVIAPETLEEKGIKLDIKDKNILSILVRNSRTPVTRIAKILGYSKEVVSYRIERLVKEGIITDFYAVIDSTALGYLKFNIYLEFYNLSKDDEQMVIAYLRDHRNVSWIISTSGKWDFMIQLYTRTIQDLDAIMLNMANKFTGLLKAYEIFIISGFMHLPPRYLTSGIPLLPLKALPYAADFEAKKDEKTEIDKLDLQILKILEEDARTSLLDMSRKLELSKDAIKYRIRKLIRQGIIKDFLLRFNYHKLGFQYYSLLLQLKNVDIEKRKKILSYFTNRNETIALFVQIGSWNLAVQVIVKNAIELKAMLSECKDTFKDQIEDTDSVLYFNQYYFTYLPQVIMEQF
ncbi:MAG: winged helix-turn-helix transcriptional regulator [Nanoarchaeota archaeon]